MFFWLCFWLGGVIYYLTRELDEWADGKHSAVNLLGHLLIAVWWPILAALVLVMCAWAWAERLALRIWTSARRR